MMVQIINEVTDPQDIDKWQLCFQWCLYVYDNGVSETGYRFIWRKPGGNLLPTRGQTRLVSVAKIKYLIDQAKKAGWGDHEGAKK